MKFSSTRDRQHLVSIDVGIQAGIAPDGGLFVPERMPSFKPADFDGLESLAQVGATFLDPFFEESELVAQLPDICRETFDFPAPMREVRGHQGLYVLELFHGPTAAFKDFGARFLAACLSRLNRNAEKPLTILVATSGDTGGAVAAAFHGQPNVNVMVFYPKGQVSPRQEKQLTCWTGNVRAFCVNGPFDACQALVKAAFQDQALSTRYRLSSANSINIGRLLPQAVYHASASLEHWRSHGEKLNFVVPTGNLGNALACVWARECGLPIGDIVLATNANRTIPDYLKSGEWEPKESVSTLASAMDVGNPSNMERLRNLFPEIAGVRHAVRASSVWDKQIEAQIAKDYREHGETWCPHTATAKCVYDQLSAQERRAPWVIVSTAHAAKFEGIVEPLIGTTIPVPTALARLLELPSHSVELEPDVSALRLFLD